MTLPVTVIGGYLGAGKTTLINHLLRHANGQRLAVLVNEFGDLSIDQDLIEAEDDGLMSIAGGCVCCAYGSDMVGALEDMRDATPAFDHVLLEASGVAIPASIMTTVGLVQGLRPDAIVVLADCEQIRKNAANKYLSDTVLNQLRQADILLVTKVDLVSEHTLSQVTCWLQAQAPDTRLLCTSHGEIPTEAIVGVPGKHIGRSTQHALGHNRFASTVLVPKTNVDADMLARRLAEDDSITRAKGFVPTRDGLRLIHVVGTRWVVEPTQAVHDVGLVCIGVQGDFSCDLQELLEQCQAA